MTRPTSPTARHLFDAVERSPKTQREIAREAGFTTPNILSMIKTGETKVPMRRITRLAQALDIEPGAFINIALQEYHPDLHAVLSEHYGIGLTRPERVLLEVYHEACHVVPLEMNEDFCNLLLQLFTYAGHMQAELQIKDAPDV